VAVKRLAILQKKRGDVDQALRLWEQAAEKGHIYAHIELAKYYEHKKRDPKTSLQWARSARKEVEHADLPPYIRKHWLDEIDHRLARLERKAGYNLAPFNKRRIRMDITISQEQGRVVVSVIRIDGHLDGQTYQELIAKAREVVKAGAKNILLDLSDLTYISSAGLVSLQTIALMTRSEEMPDPEHGWSTLKSMDSVRNGGLQKHLKLLNPRTEITNVLDMVGFSEFFEVFTDKQKAVDSF
jgi:anti-anti-sigma factor